MLTSFSINLTVELPGSITPFMVPFDAMAMNSALLICVSEIHFANNATWLARSSLLMR
jgi:hypothetical protein